MLWVVAALIAAAITGIAFLPHHTKRDAVAQYITQVDQTGRRFARRYNGFGAAAKSLASKNGPAGTKSVDLQKSAAQLSALRVRLARIPAPADARVLRARLLAYYGAQERVAHELAGIFAYFPKLRTAEAPVTAAATRLRAALKAATTPAEQAKALGAYAAVIDGVSHRIAAVDAPPVLLKARDAESNRLAKIGAAVSRAQHALLANDRSALNGALRSLDTGGGTAAALAARAAIVAYNRDVKTIGSLGARVERERQRLEQTLPGS